MSERKIVKPCESTGLMLGARLVDCTGVEAGHQRLAIPHNRDDHKATMKGKGHWKLVRGIREGFLERDIVPG